jgi:hypothetical protein
MTRCDPRRHHGGPSATLRARHGGSRAEACSRRGASTLRRPSRGGCFSTACKPARRRACRRDPSQRGRIPRAPWKASCSRCFSRSIRIGIDLEAQDVLALHHERSAPKIAACAADRELCRLGAPEPSRVRDIYLTWTDVAGVDGTKLAKLYQRKGFQRCGEIWKRGAPVMSGILKGLGKVFKKVFKVVKKVLPYALAIGAIVLTGGAALGVLPAVGTVIGGLGLSAGVTAALTSAVTMAGWGGLAGLVTGRQEGHAEGRSSSAGCSAASAALSALIGAPAAAGAAPPDAADAASTAPNPLSRRRRLANWAAEAAAGVGGAAAAPRVGCGSCCIEAAASAAS